MGKILIVSAVYPPEPVVSARLSFDIYDTLKALGEDVTVLHPRPSRPNGYLFEPTNRTIDEVETMSFTCPKSSLWGRFRESISFGKATFSYIKTHYKEIDVIYANTWPLFSQYYLARAAKKYKIPFFIHVQDIYPESYCFKMPMLIGKFVFHCLLPIDRYVVKNAERVIAISPSMITYLSKSRKVKESSFILIRNWQDDKQYIDAYRPLRQCEEPYQIMYLGSINPTANVSLIIKSLAMLDRRMFHLSIIGDGPERYNCEVLARQKGLDVSFGAVSPEQVADKQRTANVLVLCLKKGVAKTATPSKLTAYMLSGRPIIASVDLDSDCANIIREVGGIVVEPDNETALCEAIQIMANKQLKELQNIGQRSFDYAINHLSKQKNISVLTNCLLNFKNE